jgi:hypothetical protein
MPIPTDIMHDGWRVIHDGWLALMIAATAPIAFVPELLIQYRQHGAQQIGLRAVLEADPVKRKRNRLSSVSTPAQFIRRRPSLP